MSHEPFKGTARFELKKHLGSGTAGVVYEAWDRERGGRVALKLLHQSDAASLYRFKQEFRALAHLSHPNLIQLYELLNEDGQWFVTMELVDGVDFIRHVRSPEVLAEGMEALEDRLRVATRQLARGLRALHVSGRLHRDIKPSNVLVTREGRVVLLDFGLVTKATALQTFRSLTEDILGTPAYMAPEQGGDRDLTEATDWYGVGALIYEALTGKPPFAGQFVRVMLDKQKAEPPSPRELVPEISHDLDELCRELLRRDAEARPGGPEVLELLGAGASAAHRSTEPQTPGVLVGRKEALERMRRCFARVLEGEGVTLYVHGASGLGKSVLVRHFLLALRREHPDAVVLAGRCYEHESVPYKAFDSVIDMLTRYLRSLPEEEVAPILPRDVLVLARLFPVLRRVRAIADAERGVLEIPDSLELRSRAFAALLEILTRMGEDHPLVLFIDDLQWGDYDSAGLLSALMGSQEPPPILWIGAYRDEDADASPLVRELRAPASSLHAVPGEDLEIRELRPEAAEELARELLGDEPVGGAPPDAVARDIARESRGNPLFIEELALDTLAHGRVPQGGLDEVFRARLVELPAEARRLLEVLAVAGRPIEIDVARRAALLEPGDLAAFTVLRVGKLARSTGSRGIDSIEIFHDRLEKAVLAELQPALRRDCHRLLARELESTGRGDPEALAHHFAEAEEDQRALEYATEAAETSARVLAFNRAARLFRLALDLEPGAAAEERALRRRLAEVLASAGRSAEAAEVYLRLAEGASAAEGLEMRRLAAERWLVCGHIDRGLETLDGVLASIGWKLARSPTAALWRLVARRAWLRLRGHRFTERDATQISAEKLTRIDTCWSAALGLGVVDTVRGADFQTRHLQLALAAGEPVRVARALAIEVAYVASAGERRARRARRLLRRAVELAERVDDPYTSALTAFARGLASDFRGRWKEAVHGFDAAEKILRERCTGVAWEIDNVHFYTLTALVRMGRVEELRSRLPRELEEARERGDLYVTTNIESRVAWFTDLAADAPEDARARLESAIAAWSRRDFHLQHLWSLLGRVEAALYAGEVHEARREIDSHRREVERSLLLHVVNVFVDWSSVRARTALAAAVAGGGAEAAGLLKAARREARRLARRGMPWSNALAELALAGAAAARGLPDEALRGLTAAEEGFSGADMALHAAVARFRRGELLGGDQGRELRDAAARWMEEKGIVNPTRMVALMAPGFSPA